jgi:S-adenosylmethionine:tRNA ribosyltransferase-isomerase
MVLDRLTGKQSHRMVGELPEILSGPELRGLDGALPLLVLNNSKVRKARIIGISLDSGASVEFLLLEKIQRAKGNMADKDHCSFVWKSLVKHAKRRKPGSRYVFYDEARVEIARAEITGNEWAAQAGAEFRSLAFDRDIDDAWLDRYGHIPLPPYIKRHDAPQDADRYQTVYAAAIGSAAAPTAGLHFTRALLDQVAAAGIETAFITLHVGLGTFLPVRSADIEDHVMHSESFAINEQTAAKIETAKAAGRKIVAVGTTAARALESAWDSGRLKRGEDNTSIFIYPGCQFNVVDALFTNFHTPESTLLMLVSAFAGRELILESYAKAIGEGYRFFSYGDAMLIL